MLKPIVLVFLLGIALITLSSQVTADELQHCEERGCEVNWSLGDRLVCDCTLRAEIGEEIPDLEDMQEITMDSY